MQLLEARFEIPPDRAHGNFRKRAVDPFARPGLPYVTIFLL